MDAFWNNSNPSTDVHNIRHAVIAGEQYKVPLGVVWTQSTPFAYQRNNKKEAQHDAIANML